jgi:MoxR-like ATPase
LINRSFFVVSAKPLDQPVHFPSAGETQQARQLTDELIAKVGSVILGKSDAIRLAVACLLARGHLLFEDMPGVGKTMLSQALAQALGLQFRRVQFTSDLLPADILGASIYDRGLSTFVFHPGPVFAQVLLADEINRGTPKTQSALLEAMEEGRVTADGTTHPLPSPFFVIATQNPLTQIGTFPLPESQLDRFLMRLELGIPDRAAERTMLEGGDRREILHALVSTMTAEKLAELQKLAQRIHTAPALLDYLQDLLAASRQLARGLSPRAGLAILSAARAWALMQGRPMVIPEDVQAVGIAVMAHRLEHAEQGATGVEAAAHLLQNTPVV